MKVLFLAMLLTFVSCDLFKPKEPEAPTSTQGQCVSNEEAAAMGVTKKCSAPGCVCISDVHDGKLNNVPHCHSVPEACSIEPIK